MIAEMITHYPQTGPEMHAGNDVLWEVYDYRCPVCDRTMVEVTPDFEPPEYPVCAFCRDAPLPNHLKSEFVDAERTA